MEDQNFINFLNDEIHYSGGALIPHDVLTMNIPVLAKILYGILNGFVIFAIDFTAYVDVDVDKEEEES